jgi:hypothetical protein
LHWLAVAGNAVWTGDTRDAGHSFPVRIAKRPASGYRVTFTVPNALAETERNIPVLCAPLKTFILVVSPDSLEGAITSPRFPTYVTRGGHGP